MRSRCRCARREARLLPRFPRSPPRPPGPRSATRRSIRCCGLDRLRASAGTSRPYAQPAVGSRLRDEEHPTPVGEPGCRDLDPCTKVQDLAVFDALYVYQPDLLSGRVRLVARVEHVGTLTVQLGPEDTTLLGSGQHQPFARLQVVPVEPVGLDLLSGLGVEVGGVDEPTAVRMQLAAPEVIVRVRRGERIHHPWLGEPDPEEPDALIPISILRYQDRLAVRGPGDDYRVPPYSMGETEGRL